MATALSLIIPVTAILASSLLTVSCNSCVAFIIVRRRLFQNEVSTFVLVSAVVACSLILSTGNTILSAQCIYFYANSNAKIPSNLTNALLNLPYMFGSTLEMLLMIVIAMDRLYAVAAPLRYMKKKYKETLGALLSVIVLAALTAGSMFINLEPAAPGFFVGATAGYSLTNTVLWSKLMSVLSFVVIAVYAILGVVMVVKTKKLLAIGNKSLEANGNHIDRAIKRDRWLKTTLDRQRKTTNFVLILLAVFVATHCFGYIGYIVIESLPGGIDTNNFDEFYNYSYLLTCLGSLANIVVYQWRIPEIRKGIRSVSKGCRCAWQLKIELKRRNVQEQTSTRSTRQQRRMTSGASEGQF